MSIQSCYFCVQDVEKRDFECVTGINAVSFFPACSSSCVLVVFNSSMATPAYGILGLSRTPRLRFILENANLLALYICVTTHGPSSLRS